MASLNDTWRSNVDLQLGRYNIIGSAKDKQIRNQIYNVPKDKYARDPEAYYPYVSSENEQNIAPVEQKKFDRPNVYSLDKKAYYNPTGQVFRGPVPNMGKSTPIVMGEIEDTFPTERNLNKLRMKLKAILTRENLSYNEVFEKGIYSKDSSAYYDTSLEDTVSEINDLKQKIIVMEKQLNENLRNDLKAEIKTEKVAQVVQNQINHDAEIKSKVMRENYVTPIDTINGNTTELNVGSKVNTSKPKGGLVVVTGKEEVDTIVHNLQEAEELTNSNTQNGNTTNSAGTGNPTPTNTNSENSNGENGTTPSENTGEASRKNTIKGDIKNKEQSSNNNNLRKTK